MTWKKKGNRIRASDKSLVYHFCIGWLLLLFVAVFLLLNLRQLLVIDWKDFNLLHAGITWTAYNSITVLIATGVCALVAFLYYRYGYDRIKRLLHRQKLARMVLENKWYEAENTKDSVFFTDLQSRSREKIVWFPKIYYQMDNGLLHILCEITMGKYQEQLLSLEDKLESGLYLSLIHIYEKEILLAQIKNDPKESQKPEKVINGMIEGRINKELKEICLVDQVYVKAEDGKQTVAKYLEAVSKEVGTPVSIKKFIRFETGEGLEKKNEDFAAEVAAQMNA